MVTARFEGDVERCSPCHFSGGSQRMNLGMSLAIALMPAFTDNSAVLDDDRTHQGIGFDSTSTANREFECPLHVV